MFGSAQTSIVNIGSLYSLVSAPGRAAYPAAKHGIVGLTRSLALEWGRHGVRVNAVLPGWIDTDMFRSQVEVGRVDLEYLAARIPLGELGSLSAVADIVAFLCSDGARYVTGQSIAVDGGYLATGSPAPFAG
jgi:NAD(P)-dependent dehydrogenase (short-subunit alcohol dehydrogenase family)